MVAPPHHHLSLGNAFPTARTCVRSKPRAQWLSQLSRGSCCFLTLPSRNENSSKESANRLATLFPPPAPHQSPGADENKPRRPFGEENCFKIELYAANKRRTRWFPWRSGWHLLTASSSPAPLFSVAEDPAQCGVVRVTVGQRVRTGGAWMVLAVIVT